MKDVYINELNALEMMLEGKKFKNIFFVACGGSMSALMPAQYFIDKEIDIPSFVYNSGEFNTRKPFSVGVGSLVIVRSHSGTTPETVEAAKYAKAKGATVIAISMVADSPLCKESDLHLTYEHGDDILLENGEHVHFWMFFFKLAYALKKDEKYLRGYDKSLGLVEAITKNVENYKVKADSFGRQMKREKIIYTLSSGENYSITYAFSTCLLLEMLWINSNPIHSGEYFHGPFEITDYDVPFLALRGMGATQSLDDRSIAFAKKFTDKLYVVDAQDFDLSMFDEDLREYFAVPVASRIFRKYADGLAEHTGHPLSVRRYMWKMEY